MEQANDNILVPVWSWKSYSTDIDRNQRLLAADLKQLFGDAKILITIRHLIDFLQSTYLQQLKRDDIGPGSRHGKSLYDYSFEGWVRKEMNREVATHIDYANICG